MKPVHFTVFFLLAFGIHAMAQDITYVIDNSDYDYYTESFGFGYSNYDETSYKGAHRFNGKKNAWAQWKLPFIKTGIYEVFFHYPAAHDGNCFKPKVEIGHGEGVYQDEIDLSGTPSGTWVKLGKFGFRKDRKAYVKVIHQDQGVLRVDAIKLKKVSAWEVGPVATDPEIEGSLAPYEVLTFSYRFADFNGDEERNSECKWLAGNSKNGDQWEVLATGTTNSRQGSSYLLKAQDAGKYIKCVLTPKSAKDPETGKSVSRITGPVASKQSSPVAKELNIEGKPWKDYVLKATYAYSDINGDEESLSECEWLSANDADAPEEKWRPVKTITTTASEGATFKISGNLTGQYLRFAVLPRNDHAQGTGKKVFSEVIGPVQEPTVAPEVKNIRIIGQIVGPDKIREAAVGGTMEVDYDYVHPLNCPENKTQTAFQWYVSDDRTKGFEPVKGADSPAYKVTRADGWKYIKVGIVPVSDEDVKGKEYQSKPLQVAWKLEFAEEFDYRAEDGNDPRFTKKWTADQSQRSLGDPTIHMARIPENVEVKNGKFYIHNRKETNPKYDFEHTWTTSHVWTNKIYKYGYYECSYKYAPATGLNQSFWLMTPFGSDRPDFCEVDFNEGHYPYDLVASLHHIEDDGSRTVTSTHYKPLGQGKETFGDGFNKFAGLLKPNNPEFAWDAPQNQNTYQVFFNDSLIGARQSLPYEPHAMRIFLSVAIYPGYGGRLIDSKADGTSMVVDYVRYYAPLDAK